MYLLPRKLSRYFIAITILVAIVFYYYYYYYYYYYFFFKSFTVTNLLQRNVIAIKLFVVIIYCHRLCCNSVQKKKKNCCNKSLLQKIWLYCNIPFFSCSACISLSCMCLFLQKWNVIVTKLFVAITFCDRLCCNSMQRKLFIVIGVYCNNFDFIENNFFFW